ncbi:MAG: SNF2-related protein, partial [Candidatus Cloacimonetes bacterium]|nr:SNF2-related protein [Candidatus Cloacimonadota bacterium]
MEKYGKTWWGEHWLRSLENVDYDNRLPRGASYARAGHVKSIKITENQILAKVSGSRSTPYKVTIIVPPFFVDDIERLMSKLIEQPILISKLLNRELDPSILEIAENLGLRVFPRQWTDFKMQCNCPDWAVPCKHLASVIYMLSREIDNNPFLVFEIHKVDLLKELKKRGIFIPDQKKEEIPLLSNLLKTKKSSASNKTISAVYDKVDFSQLQNISESLVRLLPDMPPFYPSGNFRDKYGSQIFRISKETNKVLSKKLKIESLFNTNQIPKLTNRTKLMMTIDGNNKVFIGGEKHEIKELAQLIPALFVLNPDHLLDFEPSVVAFHKILLASLHILANGMVIPQIVQLDDEKFIIRWLPAMIDSRVKTIVEKLSIILPEDILQTPKMLRKKEQILPLENQVIELLSLFIGKLIEHLSKPSINDLFENLFFKSIKYGFTAVAENALSGGIKVWLDRYHLASESYKLMLTIEEKDDNYIETLQPEKTKFNLQISVEDALQANTFPIPLGEILTQEMYAKQRFKILQSVSLLSSFINGLDEYVNNNANSPIGFDNNDFAVFLMNVLPAVRLLNISILLPKSLQEILRPKVSIKIKKKNEEGGFININDILSYDWQVALGDTVVSPEDFEKMLQNASNLFKYKENYIYVNETDLVKLHKAFNSDKDINPYQLLQTALAEEYEGSPVLLTKEVQNLINDFTSSEDIPLPEGLKAQLRPYQQRGFSWMYRNSRIGFGSLMADDMGLGKTLQVISILLKLKEEKGLDKNRKALVIVPTGLLTNWLSEFEKFAPSLSVHIHHGVQRDLSLFEAEIMLTTYGILRSDFELLRKQKWQIMIIDEAQNIKNNETAQTKAVKSIPASIRIAMSGTPVENRLSEFWSIMDYTNKGYLGTIKTFKEDYANPIQVFNDEKIAQKFRRITAPFMMRRMKTDKSIISDLPDKIEQNQYAKLTQQQAALYEKSMHAAMEQIEGCKGNDQKSLFKRQGLVLQMILALKQICNHPTQFLKNGVFDASLSGKTELLLELLDSIIENGEKVLIFTQFTEMGNLLEHFISEKFGEKPMFYHG